MLGLTLSSLLTLLSFLTEGDTHTARNSLEMGLSLGWGAHLHITFANYFAKAELNISLFAGCGLNNSLLLYMKMVGPSIRQESPFITLLKQTPPPPMWFLHGMRRHVLLGEGNYHLGWGTMWEFPFLPSLPPKFWYFPPGNTSLPSPPRPVWEERTKWGFSALSNCPCSIFSLQELTLLSPLAEMPTS